MHSIRTVWREPAYVLGFVAIIAIVLYDRKFVNPSNFEGYWVSTFANASIFLIFSCPVGSASAAMASARARRAGIWALPLARSRVAITFRLLLPSFVAGFVAQLLGLLLLASATWGAPGRVPFEIVLAWAAILFFHITVGYLLGRFLPVAASIPLAIFISYCWLGFTWSVSYFPVRYLSGLVIASCCSIETTIDERSIVAVVVFSLLMGLAFLLFATVQPTGMHWSVGPLTGVAAAACGVIALSVGLVITQGLGADPSTPRPRADLVCTGKAPTICVYPQQLEHNDPRPVLEAAYKNLHDEGIPLPGVITASNTEADRSSLRVVLTTRPTTGQLVYTTAAAMLPDNLAPYCGNGADYPKRMDDAAVASWWLQTIAAKGLIPESSIVPPDVSPDSARLIQGFKGVNTTQQRNWYLAAAPALRHCASKPIEIPSR